MTSTVLIVEDDPGLAAELADVVRRWQVEVEHATTIEAALDAVESGRICLVLLDPMTAASDHPALIYEGGEVPIVLIPVALQVTPAFRIERSLVAPESLQRLVKKHCASSQRAAVTS